MSIPGEASNAMQDVGSAGIVGAAVAGLGKSVMRVADDTNDMIVRRDIELKKQRDDAILIDKGAQINDDVLTFEQNYKKENKGQLAFASQETVNAYLPSLIEKYKTGDDALDLKLNQHIQAHGSNLKTHLAGYEAQELKNYSADARTLDFETSKKMAQNGDVAQAVINYKKTLDTQKANYSLSDEDHQIEMKKGISGIYEAYINELVIKDPVSARKVFEVAKKDLLTDTQEKLEKVIKPAVTQRLGTDAGVEIFKADITGKLEAMTDAVRAKKLEPDAEKVAISQVKELYHERKIDEDTSKKAVFDEVYSILEKASTSGGGRLNRQSDIPNSVLLRMRAADPKLTMEIEDRIAREQRQQANINKAEVRAAIAEKKQEQSLNATLLLGSPDLQDVNLMELKQTGKISKEGYVQLLNAQEKNNPVNRASVKNLWNKINTGTALRKSLKLGANEENIVAVKKAEYSQILNAWAYNHRDDPNFYVNINKFAEANIFNDMMTDIFKSRDEERRDKGKIALDAAGGFPQRRKTDKKPGPMDAMPSASGNNGRVIRDTQTGKRMKSNGKEWVEVQ